MFRILHAVLTTAAGAAIAAAQPYGHPSPWQSYPMRPGFSLWLVEEFDAPLDLNSDPIWTWSDGGLHEGKVRFVKDAIKFVNGKMRLEVRPQGQPGSCSHAELGQVDDKPLTSGELRTRLNMFRYGYYEIRMRAPQIQPGNPNINGNFISSMFVFRTPKQYHWREIDIELTGDEPDKVTMTVFHAENTRWWRPQIQQQTKKTVRHNLREDFHTIAFQWLPSGVTWFLDGEWIGSKGLDGLPVPEMSTKIMMNLWIFDGTGGFGGTEWWNNRYPMYAEYDWFRFYKWDGDHQYPCADPSGSCLSSLDWALSSNNPCDRIPMTGGYVPCYGSCWSAAAANQTAAAGAPKQTPVTAAGNQSRVPKQTLATAAENQSRVFYP